MHPWTTSQSLVSVGEPMASVHSVFCHSGLHRADSTVGVHCSCMSHVPAITWADAVCWGFALGEFLYMLCVHVLAGC